MLKGTFVIMTQELSLWLIKLIKQELQKKKYFDHITHSLD